MQDVRVVPRPSLKFLCGLSAFICLDILAKRSKIAVFAYLISTQRATLENLTLQTREYVLPLTVYVCYTVSSGKSYSV